MSDWALAIRKVKSVVERKILEFKRYYGYPSQADYGSPEESFYRLFLTQ